VQGEAPVTIPGIDGGPSLEGMLRAPPGALRAVVLCHPHPLYGGTMHSAVVLAIAKMLASAMPAESASLRFNFRGVGASGGVYEGGRGEPDDARAAIRYLRERCPGSKTSVCGYSFGSWVGLRAAALEGGVERVALVAPAVRIFDFVTSDAQAFSGRLAIFAGTEDEFCAPDEAAELARSLGASLHMFEGADHFFLKSRRKLAEAVLPAIAPEAP
jgi:alpha/beta superfamily hydrolase